MNTGNLIRVLVADDNKAVRDVLALLVKAEPDLQLVGTARDGQEALAMCQTLLPDVVLMDLAMPVMGGVEAIHAIRAAQPDVKIVLLTNADPVSVFVATQDAPPDACLPKHHSMQQVFVTIRNLMSRHDA